MTPEHARELLDRSNNYTDQNLFGEAEELAIAYLAERARADVLQARVERMQRSRDRYREAWEAEKRRYTEAAALADTGGEG